MSDDFPEDRTPATPNTTERAEPSAAEEEAAPTVERGELREATLTSVRWVTATRGVVQVVAFGSSIVLARLIPPAEFGRAAVGLITIALAMALMTQGFGAPLVRFDSLDHSQLETATFLSLLSGIALTCATFFLAPAAFEPLFGSRIATFIQIASPAWFVAALATVPLALLQRKMDFRRISLIEISSLLIGTATSLGMATAGFNGEALVTGAVVTAASSSVFYLRTSGVCVPRWDRTAARQIAGFGAPVALSSLAYTGFLNVDYAVLAARLGAGQLGLYWRGYQLAVEYQSKVSGILLGLALPIYSRSENLEDMKTIRGRISRLHATVLFAPLLLLIPLAPTLVPLLFGEAWRGAVVPTQILVVAGMVAAVATGLGPLLVAAGKAMALLWLALANLVSYGAMVYFVAPYGLTAVCSAVAAYSVLDLVIFYVVVERLIGIPVLRLVTDSLPGLVSGTGLLAVAFPLTRGLDGAGLPPALIVVTVSAAGAAAYALVLRLAFASTWNDVVLLIRRMITQS